MSSGYWTVKKYTEALQYMLENNCKLEQEIVSLRL